VLVAEQWFSLATVLFHDSKWILLNVFSAPNSSPPPPIYGQQRGLSSADVTPGGRIYMAGAVNGVDLWIANGGTLTPAGAPKDFFSDM